MNVPLLDVPFGTEAEGTIQSGFIRRDGIDARPSAAARFALMAIADLIEASANQIDRLERAILVEAKRDENMHRLTAIPGLGAIMAATIKALVPDPGGFKSARRFAAWLGLTLRPHSSGGKERLGRISKMGNPELRALRVVGGKVNAVSSAVLIHVSSRRLNGLKRHRSSIYLNAHRVSDLDS